jgi:hypothetical protein
MSCGIGYRFWVPQTSLIRLCQMNAATSGAGGKYPHVAEFIIGRRFAPTRWLMRATGYSPTGPRTIPGTRAKPFLGEDRKLTARRQNGAFDPLRTFLTNAKMTSWRRPTKGRLP